MMIKVCGIKYGKNLVDLSQLSIDMVGYNFYPPSSRYLSSPMKINDENSAITKVGVFVNADMTLIKNTITTYKLDMVQLHGGESPAYCQRIKEVIPVIKVFSVSEKDDLDSTEAFDFCDYFLFDTKTKSHGGSGQKFNWSILNNYKGKVPFLLAGGIGPEDAEEILTIDHPQFVGVDINSKFEVRPGEKNIKWVETFIKKIQASSEKHPKL